MKQQTKYGCDKQRGIALPIVMVILVLSALIVLYIANTSRKEQQISADHYRTEQSLDAAMAGLDWAVDYYNTNGLDTNNDDVVDFGPGNDNNDDPCKSNCTGNTCPKKWCIGSDASTDDPSVLAASGDLIVQSRTFFCKTDADANGDGVPEFLNEPEQCSTAPDISNSDSVGIVSIGYSDDGAARRVVSIQVAPLPPSPGGGPTTPLTTHGAITFLGTVDVVNRYYDYNIWSGDKMNFHASNSRSYIRDRNLVLSCTTEDRFSECNRSVMTSDNFTAGTMLGALPASFAKRGNNADVIDEDPILNTLITHAELGVNEVVDCSDGKEYFFCAFFSVNSKEDIQSSAFAIGQDFTGTDCSGIEGATGVVYWEGGTCDLTGGNFDVGSPDDPALVFIDGDLFIRGGTLYGMMYVTGTFQVAGGFTIYGSSLAEGGVDIHHGGSGKFIYDMFAVNPDQGFKGLRASIPGTWRDWELN